MKLRLLALMTLLASSCTFLLAQEVQLANDLQVYVGNDTLASPWSGGMELPQFAMTDIDRDGFKDLIVYDWRDNSFTGFKNLGVANETSFSYDPSFRENLSECQCDGWFRLVDYTGDGLEDLVCGNNGGVRAYEQVIYPGDSVGFELAIPEVKTQLNPNGNFLGLPYLRTDVSGLEDLDGDGDLDFLTFSNFSNYIDYYKNMGVENYGRTDTLIFLLERTCWGHFSEDDQNNSVNLHDTTVLCMLGNFNPRQECGVGSRPQEGNSDSQATEEEKHLGSSLLILDLDADSIMDMMVGDLSFNNMYALYNCGRKDYAYIDSVANDYPSQDVSVDVPVFPAGFLADVDNDGINDLLIGPHSEGAVDNQTGATYYRNNGLNNMPDFRFVKKGFVQQDGLEFGERATPVFFDYNNDSLLDILVGNGGYYNANSQSPDISGLALLENIGTRERPVYSLVDTNYLDLFAGHPLSGLNRFAPATGDLDGDNDDDLLLGEGNGSIYYFRNVGPPGGTAMYQYIPGSQFEMIDVKENSAPHLVDLDGDQDLDLLIGNKRGRIAYYRNKGDAQNPDFELITDEWGFLVLGNGFSGDSKPFIWDYDMDQQVELLVGTEWGQVRIYEGVDKADTDTLQYVGDLFDFDFGTNSAPAVAHIDTSGQGTFLTGIGRGGIMLHHQPLPPDTAMTAIGPEILEAIKLEVYPNPARDQLFIRDHLPQGQLRLIEMFDLYGRRLVHRQHFSQENVMEVGKYPKGIYVLRFTTEHGSLSRKVMLRK